MKVFYPFFLFNILFIAFALSAVGIINSIDSPQYFTTESLIHFRSLDMSYFQSDPHYFVWPDIMMKDGEVYNVRGYAVSILTIPFHFLSRFFDIFLVTDTFPLPHIPSESFAYELMITMLFALFSVLGIIFFYFASLNLFHHHALSFLISIFLGFGTYVWKYSSYYTRQGVSIFFIGLFLFLLSNIHNNPSSKYKKIFFMFLFVVISISYGIDIFLFLSFLISAIFFIVNRIDLKKVFAIFNIKQYIPIFIPSIFVLSIYFVLNLYWYDSFHSSLTTEQITVKQLLGEHRYSAWFSTPILYALPCVLFCNGKIPESVFSNFNYLPEELYYNFSSVQYAKQYNFFGIFSISPFLALGIASLFIKNKNKQITLLLYSCALCFFVGIILNTKVLNFWGGNQYDVRYFYPYTMFLGLPIIALFDSLKRCVFLRVIYFIFLLSSGFFSMFMGWLGVLSMYMPSLSGERRIWIDLLTFRSEISKYSIYDLFTATFPNYQNIVFILFFSFSLSLLYLTGFLVLKRVWIKKVIKE